MQDSIDSKIGLDATSGDNRKTASSFLKFLGIDHIAIAVLDLEASILFFQDVLGFELKGRSHVKGRVTGMLYANLESGGVRFVLCQGTESTSQVSELVRRNGVGVAHIALEVDNVDAAVQALKSRGLGFDATVVRCPGLAQAFSSRSIETGLSFEFIHRDGESGLLESNVQQLFGQLEQSGKY
ncbi:VOC family protein [Bradyrhizobium australafricanum]|uniref:VOC family protein n=1 Tax=Bradyrhizobium australafricanum TaxID=2821406 RepID=UPI001CE2914B|nr:VOC family protein [Bradyrhizobium australafricanum]MCA6104062.1 VOC family protein [Bradyrhizobium australafricanum]